MLGHDGRPVGWFSDADAELYCEVASLGGTVVEVGTWFGRSLSYALPVCLDAGGEMWAVDLWRGTLDGRLDDDERAATHYLTFHRNMRSLGFSHRFGHLRLSSVHAAEFFANGSLAAVYIDAHHALGSVRSDIDAWLPKVAPGGWIMGHDWGDPGVTPAVQGRLGTPQRITGRSWGFRI
jgi:hypothetical protein